MRSLYLALFVIMGISMFENFQFNYLFNYKKYYEYNVMIKLKVRRKFFEELLMLVRNGGPFVMKNLQAIHLALVHQKILFLEVQIYPLLLLLVLVHLRMIKGFVFFIFSFISRDGIHSMEYHT